MIYVTVGCDAEYGTPCAAHLTLILPALFGLALFSPGVVSGGARDYADKLLKTLLITGSLERSITLGSRPFCICAKFLAGLIGDNLNPLRVAERMKE